MFEEVVAAAVEDEVPVAEVPVAEPAATSAPRLAEAAAPLPERATAVILGYKERSGKMW